MSEVVCVKDLCVELTASGASVVNGVGFTVNSGEIFALVGESGSGKTTVATALLGYARAGANICEGSVTVDGQTVIPRPKSGVGNLRGSVVAYVPQDPSSSLSPSMRIGAQIHETLRAHSAGKSSAERTERVTAVLDEVKLPSDEEFLRRYPHQLSGGQQQRVCIAMAVVCQPKLLILDEPTTGLDVSTQAHVLATLTELIARSDMAAVYVTHDLAVVAQIARRVCVLYGGQIAELGTTREIFNAPQHPYTAGLLRAIPDVGARRSLIVMPGQAPGPVVGSHACRFAPRCPLAVDKCREADPIGVEMSAGHLVRCHRPGEASVDRDPITRIGPTQTAVPVLRVEDLMVRYGDKVVVKGVTFEVCRGECVALVGESGSGKTTLSRAIVGLGDRQGGEVRYDGELLPKRNSKFGDQVRRDVQYIFQSAHSALNPRRPIGASLAVPIRQFFGERGRAANLRAAAALERVSLPPRTLSAYPQELSGGERQRAAIARALVSEPRVLLCDEITSALDVSVQAAIVRLLQRLQQEERLSLLFVTHNTALVRTIADRVVVLLDGTLVEDGSTTDVLDNPQHPYTRELIANTPRLAIDSGATGELTRPAAADARQIKDGVSAMKQIRDADTVSPAPPGPDR